MSTEPKKYRRARLFVDPHVQGTLARQLLIHWVLACGLIFIYVLTLQLFSDGFSADVATSFSALWERFGILGIALVVISPVFIYDSVKLSHRFAGPMVSFRRSLSQLANGQEIRPLKFRQGDFWQDLANELNRVSAELQELRKQRDQRQNCAQSDMTNSERDFTDLPDSAPIANEVTSLR